MIDQLFDGGWHKDLPADARPVAHLVPRESLDSKNYGKGRFLELSRATLKAGWQIRTPDWKALPGGKRSRFTSIPMLTADEAGAELELEFNGTAVGAYVVAGPDAGILEARVDDGEFEPVDLYHRYSKGLHYPRTVMFAADLPAGNHLLTVRVSTETRSSGHAARIMKFVAN